MTENTLGDALIDQRKAPGRQTIEPYRRLTPPANEEASNSDLLWKQACKLDHNHSEPTYNYSRNIQYKLQIGYCSSTTPQPSTETFTSHIVSTGMNDLSVRLVGPSVQIKYDVWSLYVQAISLVCMYWGTL